MLILQNKSNKKYWIIKNQEHIFVVLQIKFLLNTLIDFEARIL